MNSPDRARLRKVTVDVLGLDLDDLEGTTDFFADLNIDREELADLFVAVEDAFGISFEDGMTEVRTFEDLETLLDDLIPA